MEDRPGDGERGIEFCVDKTAAPWSNLECNKSFSSMGNSEPRTTQTSRKSGRQKRRVKKRAGPGVGRVDQEYCNSLAELSDSEKRSRIRALSTAELRELDYRWRAKAIDIKSQLASAVVDEELGRSEVDPEWRKNAKVALRRTEKDLRYIQELRVEGDGCVAAEDWSAEDSPGGSVATQVFLTMWEEFSERRFDELAEQIWDRLSSDWKQEEAV